MEPSAFVSEVYRRMSLRFPSPPTGLSFEQMDGDPMVALACLQYKSVLPANKEAAILDIGFGNGWFMAACVKLGYKNLYGADFGVGGKGFIREWSSAIRELYEIESNIGDFLVNQPERYDFIHLSHVLEHVPKYTLLYVVDSMYWAMKKGGRLFLRCPNMEGPCALSSMYVTLGHEYGFTGSNLSSLLSLCNFEGIEFHRFRDPMPGARRLLGSFLRWVIIMWYAFLHRLFGVNYGKQFQKELIISAVRGELPPLFDEKHR